MINTIKKSPLSLPLSLPLLFPLLFLFSCSAPHVEEKDNTSVVRASQHAALANQSCATGAVKLTANFAAGRMDECKRVADNEFQIVLVAENNPIINSSPWYAFKVQAEQNTDITITMKVRGDEHRYPPKISRDGEAWQLQDYKLRGKRLIMKMTASNKPVIIAAQEIINNQYYVDWATKLAGNNTFTHSVLGNSTQGRPIYKMESRNDSAKDWLVILGRQHPPEVTGALALFPFVETLLSNNKLSQNYLEKFNVLVIPNINPDGVQAGNWRSNANGLDLNRDWNDFSQVETRMIDDYLQQLVKEGQKIKFAVDFHSTKSDIFYTMPVDYGVEQAYFVTHWLADLDKQMPNFNVVIRPGNNPDLGVSKQYFSDKFGVHAITYEMGDNTDRIKIKRIAYNSARLLMTNMLSDVDHDKE
ncbi:zinc carboxypeptidase [Colwellia sp. 75C3]|uniref:M14 family metallopeptidase n=1 Tax=Colwellia sp. 75C3 TaxID=888425 RepID=UPI000C3452D4|nr:M14 family metallopeptidase [Colwellia sp. 75C3]PKG80761.1 zinc carboxypeptidase [Colwellia sp. 75C3]